MSLEAELEALFHGLSLAWSSGARNMVCYSDLRVVLAIVVRPTNPKTSFGLKPHLN